MYFLHVFLFFRLLGEAPSTFGEGIRATQLFQDKPSKCISCIMMEIEPQKSTIPEKYLTPTAIVFVLNCENDLASFILNGAKMELRLGDHLTIPTGSVFQFINSSLSTTLRLRFVQKLPSRVFGQERQPVVPQEAIAGSPAHQETEEVVTQFITHDDDSGEDRTDIENTN